MTGVWSQPAALLSRRKAHAGPLHRKAAGAGPAAECAPNRVALSVFEQEMGEALAWLSSASPRSPAASPCMPAAQSDLAARDTGERRAAKQEPGRAALFGLTLAGMPVVEEEPAGEFPKPQGWTLAWVSAGRPAGELLLAQLPAAAVGRAGELAGR